MSADGAARPGAIARFRSRQSGHPSGLVGRVFGRAMVEDTADANDRTLALLDPTETFTDIARVLRPGGTLVIASRTSDTPSTAWMDPDIYRIPTAARLANDAAIA